MKLSEERAKFRQRKVWTSFRELEIERRGCCCEICGKKLTKLVANLHHRCACKTMEEYENLSPERFLLLCTSCHDWVHLVHNSPVFKHYSLAMAKEGEPLPTVDIGILCSKN